MAYITIQVKLFNIYDICIHVYIASDPTLYNLCILIHCIYTRYIIGGDAYARRVRRVRQGHERRRDRQPLRYVLHTYTD